MLYYPAVESTDEDEEDGGDGGDLRAGAHSDFGSLTLLFQLPGQPGLEILTPGGEWAGVPVDPRGVGDEGEEGQGRGQRALPILVNIGDLLEDVRFPLFFSLFSFACQKSPFGELIPLDYKKVDEQPPKIDSPPGRISQASSARQIQPRLLLPPARRRPALSRAQRDRARAC